MEKILKETIDMYNDYIPKVINGCNVIISDFRENNIGDALISLNNLIGGLEWLEQAGTLLTINKVNNTIQIDSMNSELEELNKALENQDYFLAADIIEYEILNVFKNFKGLTVSE